MPALKITRFSLAGFTFYENGIFMCRDNNLDLSVLSAKKEMGLTFSLETKSKEFKISIMPVERELNRL